MIKSIIRFTAASAIMAIVLSSCSSESAAPTETTDKPFAESAGYTDPMDIPVKDLTCKTGGPGNLECKIEPGIKIGDFVSIGCGVTCTEGYYACCGVRCACRPEE